VGNTAILKVDILSDFHDKGLRRGNTALAKFGKLAKVGAAAAGVGLVAGATKAVSAASNLAESTNAVNVVFGKSADTITDFGKTAADAAGLSRREFQELAVGTGSLLVNFGYSTQDAADATVTLGQRAADMASVFNTDVGTALEAVNAGLRGETEPLRKFGVNLNDATLKAKALELGLYDGVGALDQNAKAQAAYAVILEQTQAVQGDFANTSGSLANVQRRIGAQFENIAAQVGQALLPAVEAAANWIADVLIPVLRDAAQWLRDNLGPAIDTVRGFLQSFGSTAGETGGQFADAADWIRGKWAELAPKFREWFDRIVSIVTTAVELVRAIIEKVTAVILWVWENFGDEIMAYASFIWDTVVSVIDTALTYIDNLIKFWKAVFTGDWEAAGQAVRNITKALWDFVANLFRRAADTLADIMSGLRQKLVSVMRSVWDAIIQAVRSGISSMVAAIQALPGRMASLFRSAFDRARSVVSSGVSRVVYVVRLLPSQIGRALYGIGSRMYEVGRSIILGMMRGIAAVAGSLVRKVTDVVGGAINAAKRLLGISSPSKVFEDIGRQVAAGMAAGITAGSQSMVAPAVAGMTPTSATSASSLSGRQLAVTVNGTTNPQQTARELAGMIQGARVRTGYAGLAA